MTVGRPAHIMATVWPGDFISEASRVLPSATGEVASLRLKGADAVVCYDVNDIEHRRRLAAGAQPLDAFRPLELLGELPVEVPLRRSSLDSVRWSEISRLPHGAVSADAEMVTRLAVCPLHIDLVVVQAPSWGMGMDLASQFAPFCRRAMFLERMPARASELMLEADFYGVGVFARSADGVVMQVRPAQYRPRRQTTAAWRFAEEIYRRISEGDGVLEPGSMSAVTAHCAS